MVRKKPRIGRKKKGQMHEAQVAWDAAQAWRRQLWLAMSLEAVQNGGAGTPSKSQWQH